MTDIDDIPDEFAAEKDAPSPPRPQVAEESIAATVRAAAKKEKPDANDWREKAAKELLALHWIDAAGNRLPVQWTVSANTYYGILCDAAGISGKNGQSITVEVVSVHIFLWLAVHPRSSWFRVKEEFGIALKDYPDLWLETILDWAETEFALGPDHFTRVNAAAKLREETMRLNFAPQAVPAGGTEPDTGETPGN